MAYNPLKTFDQLVLEIEPVARALLKAIRDGKGQYDEWQSQRNAQTNADIAIALTATTGRAIAESEVAEMDAAFSVFDSIMRYLDDDTPPVGIDQGFALRRFS